jgi:dipeptidyl aminopeptidase/acylaminoacyl peptidase
MHGGSDETVFPTQSIELSKKFSSLKIPYRLIIFEGGGHFLKNHRVEVDQQRKAWYHTYLQNV